MVKFTKKEFLEKYYDELNHMKNKNQCPASAYDIQHCSQCPYMALLPKRCNSEDIQKDFKELKRIKRNLEQW